MSKSCDVKSNQKTFYLQINQASSCCRATPIDLDVTKPITFYTDMWKAERDQLDRGIEIENCRVCWDDENRSRVSYRQTNINNTLNVIELFLTNACNHMCSYCSPKFSSMWEESIKTQGQFNNISSSARANLGYTNISNTNHDYWLTQITEYIDQQQDNALTLKLLGGEPLMQQKNLEKLLTLNSKKINELQIHTNLNPPSNKFLVWLLDNFPKEKLRIHVSIDSSPEYNHVVRAGFDQDKFLTNLQLLKDYDIAYKLSSVVSVLSIFDLPNFVKWNAEQGHAINYSRVHNPDCLQATLVPLEFRQGIQRELGFDHPLLENILTDTAQMNPIRLLEQSNYLTEYFKRVNIDTSKVNNELFQQWWNWLTLTVKK